MLSQSSLDRDLIGYYSTNWFNLRFYKNEKLKTCYNGALVTKAFRYLQFDTDLYLKLLSPTKTSF